MKRTFGAFALLTAMLSVAVALTIAPAASSAPAAPKATLAPLAPITGTVGNLTYSVTPTITGFVNQGGALAVTGNLVGTVTNTATGITTPINQAFTALVTNALATGSCTILDLTLGPLHLNLLGLVVDLNQVHLTINAVPGPGNLLGTLLCAIAGLLDPIPSAGALAAL
ncbi:MAG: hypothetical protein ACJ74P_02880, partial [Gaiellaceae bacterium]